jgi:hypothetical protein
MLITEMRIGFVQVELLANPLCAKPAPSIPFSFLLSGPQFRTQFSPQGEGVCVAPWESGYARSFWPYYAQGSRQNTQEIWRAMVPLEFPLSFSLKPSWPGAGFARAFLYPWGIGLIVDVSISGKMQFADAINKALEVRWSALSAVQTTGTTSNVPITKLLGMLFDTVRQAAFGAASKGMTKDVFTVVTPMNGEGDDLAQKIQQGDNVQKGLEALVRWERKWTNIQPPPLATNTLKTKGNASENHLLYYSDRGRAVWFPGYFSSSGDLDERLPLYHENLTMAALQTESLGLMARHVAQQLDNSKTANDWSVTYTVCAQRVAGLLGRLYGGATDIYRSRSVQNHIERSFKDDVNKLRENFGMDPLKDKTEEKSGA